jgi:hypothetical protein
MMAHNLCYTTLLDKGTIDRLGLVKDVDYIQTPNNGESFFHFSTNTSLISIGRSIRYYSKTQGSSPHRS